MTRPLKKGIAEANNPNWKGDEAGYNSIHDWLYLRLGKPRFCEACGTEDAKKYEWAAIDGIVKRRLDGWIRLCVSCHRKYDGHAIKAAVTRMARHGGKPCLDCGKLTTSKRQLCKPHWKLRYDRKEFGHA